MGEGRRVQNPDGIYLVSNRCIEGQALLGPSKAVNAIIEDNLAWAADTRGIDLFAYNFNPASFSMIVRPARMTLGKFMGDFQGLTARQINAHHNRTGTFFAGRYQCTRLLGNNTIIEELGRLLCGPCESDLVDRPEDWEGVSSWDLHQSGEALVGEREDRATYRQIRRANPDMSVAEARRRATTTHVVELAKLPMWADEPHMAYHRRVRARGIERAERLTEARTRRCSGMTTVAGWPITRRVDHQRSRAPACIADCAGRARQFRERLAEKNLQYENARTALRRGRERSEFPYGMIPPHKTWAVGARRVFEHKNPRGTPPIRGAPRDECRARRVA